MSCLKSRTAQVTGGPYAKAEKSLVYKCLAGAEDLLLGGKPTTGKKLTPEKRHS